MAEERATSGSASAERVLQQLRDVVTVVDAEGRVRFVNQAARRVLGHEVEASAGTEALDWVHPDDRQQALDRRAALLREPGGTSRTLLRVRQAGGGWRHVETHGVNLLHDPEVQGLVYVTRDVEDRARSEITLAHALAAQRVVADLCLRALQAQDVDDVLREALERIALLLETSYVSVLLADDDALVLRQQLGADPLPVGHRWPAGADTHEAVCFALREPVVVADLGEDARARRTPEQAERGLVSGAAVPLPGPDGPLGVLSAHRGHRQELSPVDVQFLQDVASVLAGALRREQRERQALVQALHDPLTGLPTRSLFSDRLQHALARVQRGGEVAVLLVDLDRFKSVNDVFGHGAGDEVLHALGPRLAQCVRASDTVARYGGDEFVVLCEDDVTHVGVARVAARIRRACSEPVQLSNGESVLLSCSVGTAWSIEQGADAAALLAAADASMYLDKRAGLPA